MIAPQTADLLIALDWRTVRGNHDRWATDRPPDGHYPSVSYACAALDAALLEWLRALPPSLHLENDVFACHGRPEADNAYLLEDVARGH